MIYNPIPANPSLMYRCQVIAGLIYPPTIPIECAMHGIAQIQNYEQAPLISQATEQAEGAHVVSVPHNLLMAGDGWQIREHLLGEIEPLVERCPELKVYASRIRNIGWEDAHILGEFYGDLAPNDVQPCDQSCCLRGAR
ncbi:MAG: hypothetical protein AWU57_318 [Marinobacter sp. T13-3]|nr:MAG: hypothetical protein AWU57_318 [Marinobacter sp. T13-3]